MRDIDVKRPAVDVVLADQLCFVSLVDSGLKVLALPNEFAAHVDIASMRAHRAARDQATLDQQMRVVPHDLAVLAGTGLGLVGVDHEVARPAVGRFLRHERPFQAGRKTRAAAAAQAGGLHLVDDPVTALVDDRLGAVPGATLARAFEAPIMEAVEIGEDAVLVGEHDVRFPSKTLDSAVGRRVSAHQVISFNVVGPPIGAENWRPFCGPGLTGLPEANPSSTLPKLSLSRSSEVSFQI